MATRTPYIGAAVSGEVLTAANLNKGPAGWIGDVQTNVPQTGIGAAATDLTGMTFTVSVGTNRKIKLSTSLNATQSTSSGVVTITIMEGATQLQAAQHGFSAADVRNFSFYTILTPTAGAHTYKLQMSTSAGTVGTSTAAGTPVIFLAEDIGPAS